MDYRKFDAVMVRVKSIEDERRYAEAQKQYQSVLKEKLNIDQHAIVSVGRATCYLRASDADSAGDVLGEISLQGLDETVQTIIYNI
jgi:hypothetical protein